MDMERILDVVLQTVFGVFLVCCISVLFWKFQTLKDKFPVMHTSAFQNTIVAILIGGFIVFLVWTFPGLPPSWKQ